MLITAKQIWLRLILRILLVPVVAGISYEFIRLAGRSDNIVLNILSRPGMWIQRLTTKEPTEEMIQVAIVSVEAVLMGRAYVDAVNEAQGIRKSEFKDDESYDDDFASEEMSDSVDDSLLDHSENTEEESL